MLISMVAAMGRNGVIGTDTGLPWHMPRDLRRFRELTMGKPVILGRRTLQLIGRPLPGRPNVVLTRNPAYRPDGVTIAHSVDEALAAATLEAQRRGCTEVVVIGGERVYRAFFPLAHRLFLTILDGDFEGTSRFPVEYIDRFPFTRRPAEEFQADEKNPHKHWLVVFDRSDIMSPTTGFASGGPVAAHAC